MPSCFLGTHFRPKILTSKALKAKISKLGLSTTKLVAIIGSRCDRKVVGSEYLVSFGSADLLKDL